MTTKDALHQLVDRFPEDEPHTRAVQAILEDLNALPGPQVEQLVAVEE